MERTTDSTTFQRPLNEGFDCNKMRNLITNTAEESFSKKFKDWLTAYTKDSREKIWTDIEYYRAF